MKKSAFTMLELIFVIVIMGILAKYGTDFLAQAYQSFISSKINNELQAKSNIAVEFVAKRLEGRIKASTIARENNGAYTDLGNYFASTANILEWIAIDEEGFRGNGANPLWSGVIDLTDSNISYVGSPQTNTANVGAMISDLSNGTAGINDAAIYFVNPDALAATANEWGWDMNTTVTSATFANQANVYIHPIRQDAGNAARFIPVNAAGADNNFSGVQAFEFYQLAWTAYAVGIDDYNTTTNVGTLSLWYNYQPWQGENYKQGTKMTIMENVSSFQFIGRGSTVKIQVCVKTTLDAADGRYSLCKEKTIL